MTPEFPSQSQHPKQRVVVDLRIIIALLLVVIIGLLVAWKPWSTKLVSDRSVQVTGEATVTAQPDEFLFYPAYEFKQSDKNAALEALSRKSSEITKQLKTLGVADKDIKTSSNGADYLIYRGETGDTTYTLQFTIMVHNLTAAQKVQEYLITTSPTGSVSPQPAFSDALRKKLEAQARTKAAQDARSKADGMAQDVGFTVVKVKAINDNQGFGGIQPYAATSKAIASDSAAPPLTVQPGENDLHYTVTVEYYIK